MKNFIITAGALLFILAIIVFQMECNQRLRQKQQLQFVADEAVDSAVLYDNVHGLSEEKVKDIVKEMVNRNLQGKELNIEVFFSKLETGGMAVTVELSGNELRVTAMRELVFDD